MSLRVTQYGEPVLRQTGELVETFDESLKDLAKEMVETMYDAEGIGLAAQQVGKAIQLCVVDVAYLPDEELEYTLDGRKPPIELIMPMVFVNPKVSINPGKTLSGEEGCLSFPDIRGTIRRPESISVKFQDLGGQWHQLECSGWFARVIQHEVDHLNGRLFIDLMESRELRMIDTKLKKLKRLTRSQISSKAD